MQCLRGTHWHVFFTIISVSSTMYAKCKRRSATSTTSLPACTLVAPITLVVPKNPPPTINRPKSRNRSMASVIEDDLIFARGRSSPRSPLHYIVEVEAIAPPRLVGCNTNVSLTLRIITKNATSSIRCVLCVSTVCILLLLRLSANRDRTIRIHRQLARKTTFANAVSERE